MRLLFITSDSSMYGANRSLENLVFGLSRNGYYCEVLGPPNLEFKKKLERIDARFTESYFKSSYYFSWKSKYPFLDLIRSLNSFFIGVAYFLNNAVLIIKRLSFYKGFDVIVSNSSVSDFGFLASILAGKKHIWFIREVAQKHYSLRPLLGSLIQRAFLNFTYKKIFISEFVENELNFKNNSNGVVIMDGVFFKEELLKMEMDGHTHEPKDKAQMNFGIVGLIHPGKGQMEALVAFSLILKILPFSKLFIVGSGRTTEILDSIKLLGIQNNVVITGYIASPSSMYKEIDFLFVCSSNEALGRVTIEGMAYGCIVIGKRSGATPLIIKHGINGFLYDSPFDIPTIVQLVVLDPHFQKILKQNSINTVLNDFTIEGCVEKFTKILESN